MDKRTLIIINPERFNYEPQKVAGFIDFVHDSLGVEAVVALSPRDAGRIAAMADDYEFIMAMAGDTNIKEILKKINPESQLLAIIPGYDYEIVKKWYAKFLELVKTARRDKSISGLMNGRIIVRC
ncbi:MAG: hypothetical protein LLG37_04520 [Spirochaetia bacterium]|nr:hypothetical protein [Spirochaetia bacterium]